MKILAVVSGGDAPGINAALWHFSRIAAAHGDMLVGADGGFPAAVNAPHVSLTPRILAPHVSLGGSFIASSREPVMRDPVARQALAARLQSEGIDGIFLFGGDGTLKHLPSILNEMGVACIALPTTIDNDVAATDRTLGFDSACNFAYASIDGAMATGRALPGRIFTVETLGGGTGHLALAIGYAVGAHAVLAPEIPFELDWLADRVRSALSADGYALVVHSEGVPQSRELPALISERVGVRVRDVHLGHAQRGGSPTHLDRALAASWATAAYQAFASGTRRGTLLEQRGAHVLFEGDLNTFPAPSIDRTHYDQINGL
ncbi:MAG: 6-phosphofructokinase [Chloroflexi bacterium]|nr:6-phosphofructokinase [Chloroflexota bacterium]